MRSSVALHRSRSSGSDIGPTAAGVATRQLSQEFMVGQRAGDRADAGKLLPACQHPDSTGPAVAVAAGPAGTTLSARAEEAGATSSPRLLPAANAAAAVSAWRPPREEEKLAAECSDRC